MQNKINNILIIGGNGFLGSQLQYFFRNSDYKFYIVDVIKKKILINCSILRIVNDGASPIITFPVDHELKLVVMKNELLKSSQ